MRCLRKLAMLACIGLLTAPAASLAEDTPTASSAETKPAASGAEAKTQAGPTNEAAEEERARKFFTDLEVIDQNGKRLRFYSDVLKGRVVLINFMFTNCPDACPMMTHKLMQVRNMMVPAIKDDVWFISISVDPDRDTPEAMKAFAEKQGVDESRWLFLTGEKQNLEFIVKRLGQYTQEVEAHSTLMLAGNDRTRHWTRVMPMVPPEGVAQQLRALAEEGKGPPG